MWPDFETGVAGSCLRIGDIEKAGYEIALFVLKSERSRQKINLRLICFDRNMETSELLVLSHPQF